MTAPSAEAVYERRWWTLGVLCISLIVISVDNTILNVALPSIVRELHAEGSQLQWIIDSYTIVFAGLLLTAGSLGDRLGRKGALTAGLTLFALFSLLASQATSPGQLIAARALMGVGGAFIFPTTLSILTNTFKGPERAQAIGIWAGVSGLGIVIGPLGGGLLLEHFAWGSVFLVNVPICIAAVVLGYFFVPSSRDPDEGRLDPVGAVLSVVALTGVLYGIIQGPDAGWGSTGVRAAIAAGAVFFALFLYWETHTTYPMLDVRFFRNPRFSAASATITLTYFALFGSTFLLTQYFQFVLGYSPLKAGLMTAPVAVGILIGAPQAPKLVERMGTKYVVVIGLFIVAAALSMYASDTIMSSVILGGLVRAMFGLGMGLTSAPATESIMGSLPPGKSGVGSAVNDTTRQAGGALGVAVIGSIFALRYHANVSGIGHLPSAVQAEVRNSIGHALLAAQRLPAAEQRLIHTAANHAYITSMRVAFSVAAAVILVAAFVSWRWLPNRAPSDPLLSDTEEAAEVSLAEATRSDGKGLRRRGALRR